MKAFEPFRIGKLELKNRLVVSAIVTNYCNPDGTPTEKYLAYHEHKARGGWGLIITEDYAIAPKAGGFTRLPGRWRKSTSWWSSLETAPAGPSRPALTGWRSTGPTATWWRPSPRPLPTSAVTSTAAPSRTGRGLRWKSSGTSNRNAGRISPCSIG